eukprot:1157282-Pelagomonas_calceolata.AAC.9
MDFKAQTVVQGKKWRGLKKRRRRWREVQQTNGFLEADGSFGAELGTRGSEVPQLGHICAHQIDAPCGCLCTK